jgi:hypothetical protein
MEMISEKVSLYYVLPFCITNAQFKVKVDFYVTLRSSTELSVSET